MRKCRNGDELPIIDLNTAGKAQDSDRCCDSRLVYRCLKGKNTHKEYTALLNDHLVQHLPN